MFIFGYFGTENLPIGVCRRKKQLLAKKKKKKKKNQDDKSLTKLTKNCNNL